MAAFSGVEWCRHSFSPWWGCTKVSGACTNCYAEEMANRFTPGLWGKGSQRRFFPDRHWNEPLRWAKAAAKKGERHRVFCAPMADVCEDRPDLIPHRTRLWALIEATSHALDWLLLTKRPENGLAMIPQHWRDGFVPEGVWWGTTVESQDETYRIRDLMHLPGRVHFLSMEPLLGPVDISGALHEACYECGQRVPCTVHTAIGGPGMYSALGALDWVIVGGESGVRARVTNMNDIRDVMLQCQHAGVPVYVKQLGKRAWWNGIGQAPFASCTPRLHRDEMGWDILLAHAKGGDMQEWPADLRVREFPTVAPL